jgi:hypothetical protein
MTNSRTRIHFVVLFGLALFGCHRHAQYATGAAGGPQATDRQVRNAVALAARDMQCPEPTLSAQQIGQSLYSIHGCGRSREYLLMCSGRHACRWSPVVPVEQVAAAETGCTAFTITEPSPIERAVSGCNVTVQYMIGCNVAACAWGHAAGGGAVAQSAPQPQPMATSTTTTTTTTVASGSATVPAGADVQGQLMDLASARWAQAQACLNGQHVDATLTLGLDGRITAQLDDPLHGTPAEACVQQVVGDVQVQMQGQASPVTVMLTL